MPELTPTVLGWLVAMLAFGFILGWIVRGGRISREKTAINVSWRDQMGAQKSEHDRLADQNKSLMEQISQYRASKKDSDLRAKELSDSLKEAFEKRDELQRQLKEMRSSLDIAVAQRRKLKTDLNSGAVRTEARASTIKEKNEKIFKLSRELENWQNRLPPLIERFRLRDLEAQELEVELETAHERIAALEKMIEPEQTRIEPVDTPPIADGMDASNDQYDETSEHEVSNLDGGEESEDDYDADEEVQAADDDGTAIDTYHSEGTVDFDLGDADFDKLADANAEAHNDDAIEEPEERVNNHDPDALDGADSLEAADEDDDVDEDDDEALQTTSVDDSQISSNSKDDLKQIKGVGPSIEKTLNDLGIYRFNQIAEMSEYDIDRVARELRGFRSRIYREDWIGQARILQVEKTSDPA